MPVSTSFDGEGDDPIRDSPILSTTTTSLLAARHLATLPKP